MHRWLLLCLALSLPGIPCALSQAAPAAASRATPRDANGNPAPVDPILVMPPEQLIPAEVKRLQTLLSDYGQLARYDKADATLPPEFRAGVVFFGDSITDAWGRRNDGTPFFPGKPYINRGISGQTTPQMVVRFQQDVVSLKPAAVLILAGTNDIAGNTGQEQQQDIENSFLSMVDMADAHHIKVILASVLPVDDYVWRRGLKPATKILALNAWLKSLCTERGYTYLDYYTALATPAGAMKPGTSLDGVHPTAAGYAIMAPLAQAAIDRALATHTPAPSRAKH